MCIFLLPIQLTFSIFHSIHNDSIVASSRCQIWKVLLVSKNYRKNHAIVITPDTYREWVIRSLDASRLCRHCIQAQQALHLTPVWSGTFSHPEASIPLSWLTSMERIFPTFPSKLWSWSANVPQHLHPSLCLRSTNRRWGMCVSCSLRSLEKRSHARCTSNRLMSREKQRMSIARPAAAGQTDIHRMRRRLVLLSCSSESQRSQK